jgi:chemotaxis protein CheD
MEKESTIIEVGMIEMKICSAPNILVTRGLGSCLGIVIYQPRKKIGGLAHPMLPSYEAARIKGSRSKFVDTVISLMIDELKNQGCVVTTLVAKLFGGAHMFSFPSKDSAFNIGARNIDVAKQTLASYKIEIIGEDTGGNYGRTIFFDLSTGKVNVKTLFYGEREV